MKNVEELIMTSLNVKEFTMTSLGTKDLTMTSGKNILLQGQGEGGPLALL